MNISRFLSFAAVACLLIASSSALVSAAEPTSARALKPGQYNPADTSVDFFAAVKQGDIEVKMVHKDASQGKLFIKNKSGKPLNVKLPDTFVGVHAQMGGMGGGMGGGMQTTGGTAGGGGAAGGGAGGGGGNFFNVAPEKVGEVPFTSVCLEHGKPEPRAVAKYEIRPLESFSTKAEVREMLQLLGQGKLTQRAAQVLAWHYQSNMTMEELAAKQIENLNAPSTPYFEAHEIQEALGARAFITKKIQDAETAGPTTPKL